MPFTHEVTKAFLPKDTFHRPSRFWPETRQKPFLETPHARNS